MIRRAAFTLAATLLASSLATAQGRESAWVGTASDTIPVTFSFSGAISMGVYQAGVNWALSQFINLTHDSPGDGNQGRQYRATNELPLIDVAALSGASAGNINALLAAIEYCDTKPVSKRPPESSLFWKMWVLSGWDDLMPRDGILAENDDPGIFSRTRLASYIENQLITGALANPTHRADCRIPVGLIVTRVDPRIEQSAGGLTVQTQRFLVPFEMREAGRKLHFFQADTAVFREPSLGSMIAVGDPRDSLIDPADIFKVVEASSSYPVAFAPVYFPYWYVDPECRARPLPTCWKPESASFMDGGVFDVLPLSTGMGLYRVYEEKQARKKDTPVKAILNPRLLFVDVGLARGRLKAERPKNPDGKPVKTEGLDAIGRFLQGFVPTARQYERHVFGRTADTSAWYISTARGLPAVSEHLGYFAGFFGRPFREVDFYAGVADGLYYIAREILCEPTRDFTRRLRSDPGARPADQGGLERRECTARELTELATQSLEIDDTGLHVLNHLLSQGQPSFTILPPESVPVNIEKVNTLKAIANAEISLLGHDSKCKIQGMVTLALCMDGFRAFLDRLDADTVVDVAAVFGRWADSTACDLEDDPSRANCWAERDLSNLVEEPELQMHAYMGSVLRRLRSVEERGEQTIPKAITRLAEGAYRSTDYRYRRGMELDPSSIPPYEKLAGWGALALMPYYAGATVGIRGWQIGWQPTWHTPPMTAPWLAIGLPLELAQMSDMSTVPNSHLYAAATPSLIWRRTSLVNQIQLGARVAACVEGNCSRTLRVGPEVTAHVLSKLRFSLYRHVSGTNGMRKLAGSVSVADMNGMMYWALRR